MKLKGSITVLVTGLLGAANGAFAVEQSRVIELAAPVIKGDESIELQVTTGPLVLGARLVVMTEKGEILGAVAPFGRHAESVTATVAIPRSAIVEGRLRLRLQLLEPGAPGRPPRPGEVERLNLVVTPETK